VAGALCAPAGLSAATAPTSTSITLDPDQYLYGPDIWRLPPVEDLQAMTVSGPAPSDPPTAQSPAFAVPPAEIMPAPPAEPAPRANLPSSLTGVLSSGDHFDVKPPDPTKIWDGSFDLGLDGSEGNSDTLNVHCGFHANRKTESNILTFSADYLKQSADSVTTTDRLFSEGRFEWLFHDSRWSWYVHETLEYDEVAPVNDRDTADAGFGYRLIKIDTTTLVTRFGGGYSNEYHGPEIGEIYPELVLSVQLEHQISKRQKILGLVEYAPEVTNFERYRLRIQAAWELLLDEEKKLSLRLGALDLYNSVPDGAQPNDLDYALMVMWKF
jgi:hypothetical protein